MIEQITSLVNTTWKLIPLGNISKFFSGLALVFLVPYFKWVMFKKKLRRKRVNDWYQWIDGKIPNTWWPNLYPLILEMTRSSEYEQIVNYFSTKDKESIEEITIKLRGVNEEFEIGLLAFIKPISRGDYQAYVESLFYDFRSIITKNISILERKWGLL